MSATFVLSLLIFIAALLYSSVGHAGASGYLAAMTLFDLAPEVMKPTALALNLLVATVGTIRFARSGHLDWSLFWPFAVTSIPCAVLGGYLKLPVQTYKALLGGVLIFAAWRLAFNGARAGGDKPNPPPRTAALMWGGLLGLLSGLTGVGGGIFLSPLMLLLGWADTRQAAGISAAFILVNSAAGLSGHLASVRNIPSEIIWWAPAALIGGLIGSELGSRRLAPLTMRRMLAVVLVVAAISSFRHRDKAAPASPRTERADCPAPTVRIESPDTP